MNINITIVCDTCGEQTNCRIGMSNREEQPFRFCCQTCGSPIDITVRAHTGATFVGAKQVNGGPFDDKTNFVDLHIDFPVSFGKYVMGDTPFMRAVARIGYEAMALHNASLNQLNEEEPNFRAFGLLIKLYIKGKITPFKLSCERNFNDRAKSDKPQDINAVLYRIIARMMQPFAFPGQNRADSEAFSQITIGLGQSIPTAMHAFMDEIMNTRFLKNLQTDCLEIYPRILDAELPLRPALFLDFDSEYQNDPAPMRVSSSAFETYKDLYKDMSEVISRQLVLVAALNNLLKRGDHNAFKPRIGKTAKGKDFTPQSIHDFADVPFGKKLEYIDDTWAEPAAGGADNQLRNAIAHYKTDYDEITQLITYFPRREGIKEEKGEKISFLGFMHHLLITYREMHRFHHLVKCLLYYHLLAPSRD
jgi:hypothetical protein